LSMLPGSVFEWMNCSACEDSQTVHVSEGGTVSVACPVSVGTELTWYYGDAFVPG
jgi:hypothetical protein